MGTGVLVVVLIACYLIFARLAERLNLNFFTLLIGCGVFTFVVLAATGNMP